MKYAYVWIASTILLAGAQAHAVDIPADFPLTSKSRIRLIVKKPLTLNAGPVTLYQGGRRLQHPRELDSDSSRCRFTNSQSAKEPMVLKPRIFTNFAARPESKALELSADDWTPHPIHIQCRFISNGQESEVFSLKELRSILGLPDEGLEMTAQLLPEQEVKLEFRDNTQEHVIHQSIEPVLAEASNQKKAN